jgi:hypothetical protein
LGHGGSNENLPPETTPEGDEAALGFLDGEPILPPEAKIIWPVEPAGN